MPGVVFKGPASPMHAHIGHQTFQCAHCRSEPPAQPAVIWPRGPGLPRGIRGRIPGGGAFAGHLPWYNSPGVVIQGRQCDADAGIPRGRPSPAPCAGEIRGFRPLDGERIPIRSPKHSRFPVCSRSPKPSALDRALLNLDLFYFIHAMRCHVDGYGCDAYLHNAQWYMHLIQL